MMTEEQMRRLKEGLEQFIQCATEGTEMHKHATSLLRFIESGLYFVEHVRAADK